MSHCKKRARDHGLTFGTLPTGKNNTITDVSGVSVGQVTLFEGDDIRTGVTAILPHKGNLFREKVFAGTSVINGFGKTTGLVQVDELGLLESPIMLTNTFSVPAVTEGTLQYLLRENEEIGTTTGTVNVVVGECNDSSLNDIRGLHVRPEHAITSIKRASSNVDEGAVGAGTGMTSLGFKGGVGTSSRVVGDGTLGVLVVSNYGTRNDIDFPPGSIMMIVATDHALNERQLQRVAKRTTFGLALTGSTAHHGSGDIAIAFSTAQKVAHEGGEQERFQFLRDDHSVMNDIFNATASATEEAIWNSLFAAETTVGRDGNKERAITREEAFAIRRSLVGIKE
ncbi:S58 family peptidase [Salicibibacter halophilus]|uniref:S58 family peptidase n=1 Tax=Salicibibacter halophilus TaxID=2502791 RepID=A0A514LEW7_9BACI|nr:P1 family peptidase [Salicibibacter halophilus]QDI90394.1 S58 family peptidase [Salicibibacter halophilus]